MAAGTDAEKSYADKLVEGLVACAVLWVVACLVVAYRSWFKTNGGFFGAIVTSDAGFVVAALWAGIGWIVSLVLLVAWLVARQRDEDRTIRDADR
ncbi:MAG: hypothetical protein HYX32_13310 [Actinobacteria bacterium]|nr:hypothetical protein [Actinomycetota bacterium]